MAASSSRTKIQIVAGGVFAKSRNVGCVLEVDATNLCALNHANKRASEIATPAATKMNQSYCPGTQNSALFAINNDNKLKPKKSHFIELVHSVIRTANEIITALGPTV